MDEEQQKKKKKEKIIEDGCQRSKYKEASSMVSGIVFRKKKCVVHFNIATLFTWSNFNSQ